MNARVAYTWGHSNPHSPNPYEEGTTEYIACQLGQADSGASADEIAPRFEGEVPTDKCGSHYTIGMGGMHSQGVALETHDDKREDKGRRFETVSPASNRAESIALEGGISAKNLFRIAIGKGKKKDEATSKGRPSRLDKMLVKLAIVDEIRSQPLV